MRFRKHLPYNKLHTIRRSAPRRGLYLPNYCAPPRTKIGHGLRLPNATIPLNNKNEQENDSYNPAFTRTVTTGSRSLSLSALATARRNPPPKSSATPMSDLNSSNDQN